MYLFDKEDFKCDEIPNDWEDYGNTIRAVFDSRLKCLSNLIDTTEMTDSFRNELTAKLQELYDFYVDDFKVKLSLLIDELVANPAGSTCFNKSLFTNYIASYNIANNLVLEINGLLTFGDDAVGHELNVGVDTTIIYPTSGSSYNKVVKCVGVYMKQMDFGSEFIGSVTVMGGEPEPVVGVEWVGLAAPRDGEWRIFGNY